MAGAIPAQAFGQPAQHQVPVRLEHHVDEIDDDDPADVPQPQLADDLLGSLEVVAGDSLFEVASGSGELAGVDVDHGHRLSAVDDQITTGGQPHFAIQRLDDLLVDPELGEHVGRPGVPAHPGHEVRGDVTDVAIDGVPRVVALDHQLAEVLGEQVSNHLDQQVGFLVEQLRGGGFTPGSAGTVWGSA